MKIINSNDKNVDKIIEKVTGALKEGLKGFIGEGKIIKKIVEDMLDEVDEYGDIDGPQIPK